MTIIYKKPTSKRVYHVFTNNFDDWVIGYNKALLLFKALKKEYNTARLYSTTWNAKEGIYEDFNCLNSYGYFPY